MLGLHFTPVCVLLSACSLHFTLSLHFTPGPQSAVRSPQSTFYTDRFSNQLSYEANDVGSRSIKRSYVPMKEMKGEKFK